MNKEIDGKNLEYFSENGKEGYKDKETGEVVIKAIYDDVAASFSKGFAKVKLNGKWGFIDATGKVVVEIKYDDAEFFSEGLATVELNGKYGFIDVTGKVVIEIKYDDAKDFIEGLAGVKLNGKWGFINVTEKGAEEIKFDVDFCPYCRGEYDIRKCSDCGNICCKDCLMVDWNDEYICPDCICDFECPNCGKKFQNLQDEGYRCDRCDDAYCSDCIVDHICCSCVEDDEWETCVDMHPGAGGVLDGRGFYKMTSWSYKNGSINGIYHEEFGSSEWNFNSNHPAPVTIYTFGDGCWPRTFTLKGCTNELSVFDISVVNCSSCGITSLTASGVNELYCSNNALGSLEVSSEYLKILDCSKNNISKGALNDLFESLHSKTIEGKTVTITGNPGAAACDRTIAEKKGWTVIG